MPTYTYKCDECGAELEVVHGMSEAPEVLCHNHCKQLMRKKIGTPRTMYKGYWETRDDMGTHG